MTDYYDWLDADPDEAEMHTASIAAQTGAATEICDFATKCLRIAYLLRPMDIMPDVRLAELNANRGRRKLGGRLHLELRTLVKATISAVHTGGRWNRMTVRDIISLWDRVGLPLGPPQADLILDIWDENRGILIALSHRQEIQRSRLVTCLYPESQEDTGVIGATLAELSIFTWIPLGLLRPHDIVTGDEDEIEMDLRVGIQDRLTQLGRPPRIANWGLLYPQSPIGGSGVPWRDRHGHWFFTVAYLVRLVAWGFGGT